jgi:nicotinate-nucleotide adenylyltransferase
MSEQPPECLSPTTGSRVAFFGGSFDPPHLGHLAVARAARAALNLDRVLFAPVGAQPLKPRGSTAPFSDRVAMTSVGIAGEPGFEISLVDAPASDNRPNYTLETLGTLRAGLPPGGLLLCLMGADSFVSLRRWHGAAEIPFVASLIVASRPGQQLDDLARFLPRGLMLEACADTRGATPPSPEIELRCFVVRNPAGQAAPFYLLPNLDVEISASEIRKQVHASADDPIAARPLLPAPVAEYIRTHSLYR